MRLSRESNRALTVVAVWLSTRSWYPISVSVRVECRALRAGGECGMAVGRMANAEWPLRVGRTNADLGVLGG